MDIEQFVLSSSEEEEHRIKKVRVRIKKKRLKSSANSKDSEVPKIIRTRKSRKPEKTFELPKLSPLKNHEIRFLDEKTSISRSFPKRDSFFTVKIKRERVPKINGIRVYFKYMDKDPENSLIAKAKSKNSTEIPIAKGNVIHLSSEFFFAKITTNNDQSTFTLMKSNDDPLLDIQFMLSRTADDGTRRATLFFYPNEYFDDLTLETKDSLDVPSFRKLYRVVSVKNALLGPVGENDCYISIRKTSKDLVEVDSILDVPPLYLFTIGVASFLGRVQGS